MDRVRLWRPRCIALLGCLLAFSILLFPAFVRAAPTDVEAEADGPVVASVVVDGDMVLRVRGISSAYPAEVRAGRIAERIRALAADHTAAIDALRAVEEGDVTRLLLGERSIMAITEADARLESSDRQILSEVYLRRIGDAITGYRDRRTLHSLVRAGLLALTASVALALFLWVGSRVMRWLDSALENRVKRRLVGLEQQSQRILSAAHLWRTLGALRSVAWTVTVLVAIATSVDFVLHLFPWTRALGHSLFTLLIYPLRTIGSGFIAAIPDLLTLAVIVVVLRYLLRALRMIFAALARGSMVVENFEPEWAWPTYRLVRLLVMVLAVVVAYPYIPGSQSEVFKGLSIFFGIVFSLGSSSMIGNIIAGYALTYRRAFRVGDRVCIDEHVGTVVEMRLMVTHLRTLKNEEVIIPNSEILNKSVVNFSTFARTGELIVHTIVGIGYETPWRQVEAMLLEAASRTPGLAREPKPFVLQKSLGDFAVNYEINACCSEVARIGFIYTDLHRNILDVFNEYGIQIMTPAYEGDPEVPKIVPKEQWYLAPAVADTAEKK